MEGYSPGEQPAPGTRVIKLNTNENAFPPSPKVMQALRQVEAEQLRRYPSPVGEPFRSAVASMLGVEPAMVIVGNGSDDLLTIATRTFVPAGGCIAHPDPTYSLYPVLAQLQDARSVAVPWAGAWELPIEGLLATNSDAIYLANPNAPSGTLVGIDAVRSLAKSFDGILLIDEAYADFAPKNCLQLVREFENVVILRSLSKAYAVAGLRVGYAVAQEHIINELLKVKDSYNCDTLSMILACAAIEDQEYARQTWDHIRAERTRLTAELEKLDFTVVPSHANFVLATCPGGVGKDWYLGLKRQGILVRYFDTPALRDKIRITIGTSQEMNALLGGIKALAAAEKAA
jgi:histidinol-phosphate aminotransferase